MVIFHSYVKLPEGKYYDVQLNHRCMYTIYVLYGDSNNKSWSYNRGKPTLLPSLEAAIPSFFAGVQ